MLRFGNWMKKVMKIEIYILVNYKSPFIVTLCELDTDCALLFDREERWLD